MTHTAARLVAVLALTALTAVGCASDDSTEPEATQAPPTTGAPTTSLTVPPTAPGTESGTPLAAILEPFEARALADSMFTSYRFSCWPYDARLGTTGIDWERDEVDRNTPVSRGGVLSCLPRTDPPADVGHLDLIVLDDNGTISWWWVGSDAVTHVPAAPDGLLCREYMATQNFNDAMAWVGASPPWSDDVLAYQWVLAYWFIEGQPNRMDVDGNGVPCELVFDEDVVTDVWAGNNP